MSDERRGVKTGSEITQHWFYSHVQPQLIFRKRLIDNEFDLIFHIAHQHYAIHIGLKTEGKFSIVFHNGGDALIVTMCAWGWIQSRYRNRTRERKQQKDKREWEKWGAYVRSRWWADVNTYQHSFPERLSEVTSLSFCWLYIVCWRFPRPLCHLSVFDHVFLTVL